MLEQDSFHFCLSSGSIHFGGSGPFSLALFHFSSLLMTSPLIRVERWLLLDGNVALAKMALGKTALERWLFFGSALSRGRSGHK